MHLADVVALGQNFNDYGTAEASIATAMDLNHATPIGRLNLLRTKLAVGGQRHPTTRCRSARGLGEGTILLAYYLGLPHPEPR